ncbi:hypothetical protein MBAV_001486 [Candidatus Magnetobacterium bavaricum]|uniref:Uncharacterized protein n=1 Tax=Candidatus Magnetobacterium bavaricum TaxID=29290 RepID=A0A0F3GWR5_9BACT|nr:hypothetical protein MBAV_001486 [Candidatus Magnetobacterium bavaricum]
MVNRLCRRLIRRYGSLREVAISTAMAKTTSSGITSQRETPTMESLQSGLWMAARLRKRTWSLISHPC